MSYSQHDEERVIVDYFGDFRGRFLDLGAWDFRHFSNTRRLAELGWQGVLVEADPISFPKLMNECAAFPNVMPCHAVVSPEPGIVTFWTSHGDGISTVCEADKKRWPLTKFTPICMASVTVRQLLDRFGVAFDFVSIDLEGLSVPILQQLPLSDMGVCMVCAEHGERKREVIDYCAGHELTETILFNAENILLCKP